jgi:hypothetical protein
MVLDSSSLISLARAGLLQLIARLDEPRTIPDVVWREVVVEGRARQYPDAFAIEAVLEPPSATPQTDAGGETVDEVVLQAAVIDGTLLANDLALGRRARNLGARWLRSADLIVLLAATGRAHLEEARAGIQALWSAGRITEALRDDYLRRLE